MKDNQLPSAKCFFVGWIFSWVTAIYVPSLLIAITGFSPSSVQEGFLSSTFAVADEVAPAAKLSFAALLAAFVFVGRKVLSDTGYWAVALRMLSALAAMLLILTFLPATWSRGFGVGLTGMRFSPGATLIYVAGALLSGLVFALSEAKCLARSAAKN